MAKTTTGIGRRRNLYRLMAIFLSLGMLLLVAEVAMRSFQLWRNAEATVDHPVFHHWQPRDTEVAIWGSRGEFGGHRVRFNSDGFAMPDELPPPDTPSLLFLGDSFTVALQVPQGERFSDLVGEALDLPALNFGFGSASPILSRLELELFADRVSPKVVVLQLFSNDIAGERRMRRLGIRDDSGRIVAVPGSDSSLAKRLSRKLLAARFLRAHFKAWMFRRAMTKKLGRPWVFDPYSSDNNRPLDELYSEQDVADVGRSLIDLRDLCRSRGWTFAVMVIPERSVLRHGVPDHFATTFEEFARRNDIEFVDLLPALSQSDPTEFFFNFDTHLTAAGHRAVAAALIEALGPVVRTPPSKAVGQGATIDAAGSTTRVSQPSM